MIARKTNSSVQKTLTSKTEINIRFSEVDSLRIVWHGHYVKYMEDGREDFGTKFGMGYLTVYSNGFMTPLVKVNLEYKKPLEYGDKAIIETTYVNTAAAKIRFEFKIFKESTKELVATGETEQVFLDKNRELQLISPKFYIDWKKKWGLTE